MDNIDLRRRFNDSDYINWLKAGQCLNILKEKLYPFLDSQMRDFHVNLISQNAFLGKRCAYSCMPNGNELSGSCDTCSKWKDVIKSHHRVPYNTIYWGNCVPSRWRTDHWEVAKAFMPKGKRDVNDPGQFDIAAQLNLIHCCDRFDSKDLKVVREMIKHRNHLNHSANYHVNGAWMENFSATLTKLLHKFHYVPQMETAEQQIHKVLAAAVSIQVDRYVNADSIVADTLVVDSDRPHVITVDLISQWERELLKEIVEELLDDADDTKIPEDDQLKSLGGFLQNNRDLCEHFSTELKTINSLRKRR